MRPSKGTALAPRVVLVDLVQGAPATWTANKLVDAMDVRVYASAVGCMDRSVVDQAATGTTIGTECCVGGGDLCCW